MVSVGRVLDLLDLIAGGTSDGDSRDVLREAFFAATGTSPAELDTELAPGEVIGGLADSVYATALGLWVDHNDPFTLDGQAQTIIETHVGVADPSAADGYRYDGDDVVEGIVGFDQWLEVDHETKRRKRLANGDPQALIDSTMRNLRLIEIATGADYALAILCPNTGIDALVEAIAAVGVTASRPKRSSRPTPTSYNIGELIWDHLIEHHDYQDLSELAGTKLNGRLTRVVDAEHSITVGIVPFKRGNRQGRLARLLISIGRTDINELAIENGFDGFDAYTATISEADTGNFLHRPAVSWKPHTHAPQEITSYLDEWMPRLDTICNLDFIESSLLVDNKNSPIRFDRLWLRLVLNRALNGWNRETDDWLLDDPSEIETSPKIDAMRAWIADHPNGRRVGD